MAKSVADLEPIPFFKTARGRWLTLLLAMSLILGLAITSAYLAAKGYLESQAQSSVQAQVEVARLAIEDLLHETHTLLSVIKANPDLFSPKCDDELRRIMQAPNMSHAYTGFALIDENGWVACSTYEPAVRQLNLSQLDMYQQAQATGEFALGSFRRGELSNLYVMPAGLPVRAPNGQHYVLAVAIKSDAFQQLLNRFPLPRFSAVFIVGHHGEVLAASHSWGQDYWLPQNVKHQPLFEAMHNRQTGSGKGRGFDDQIRFYAFDHLKTGSTHQHLLVTLEESEVLANFFGGITGVMGFSAGMITLSGLLLLGIIYGLFVRRLEKLVQTADAIIRDISWHQEALPNMNRRGGRNHVTEIERVTQSLLLVRSKLDERTRDLNQTQRIAKIGSWKYRAAEGDFIFSDGMEHILSGAGLSSLLVGDFLQHLDEQDRSLLINSLHSLFDSQTPFMVLVRYCCDSASSPTVVSKHLEIHGEPAPSPSGLEVAYLGTIQDVTEYVEMHTELQRSQRFLRAVLDNLGESVVACDATGELRLFNRVTEQFHGLPVRKIPVAEAAGYYSLYTVDGKRRLKPEEVPLFRAFQGETFKDQHIRIAPDGLTSRVVKARGQPILDPNDKVIGAVVVQEDITATLVAESRARQSEEEFRLIFEAALDGLLVVDVNGNILLANQTVARLHGYEAQDLLDANFRLLLQEKDLQRVEHARTEIHKNQPSREELETIHKEGHLIPVEVVTSSISLRGQQAYLSIIRDIRERKQVEERISSLQRIEAVGQLTGGVAHDFNNLLQVILMNLDILESELEEKPELQKMVQSALKAASKGGELTKHLLAFTRQQALKVERVEMHGLIDAFKVFLDTVVGRKQKLKVGGDDNPAWVDLDVAQFEMALTHLVMNARDATEDWGDITIMVNTTRISGPFTIGNSELAAGDYCQVVVKDNGSGMDEVTRKRALEPFFTTKKLGQGSGLGLSMVYGFVQQSGGGLEIISTLGKGTEVHICFPSASEPC